MEEIPTFDILQEQVLTRLQKKYREARSAFNEQLHDFVGVLEKGMQNGTTVEVGFVDKYFNGRDHKYSYVFENCNGFRYKLMRILIEELSSKGYNIRDEGTVDKYTRFNIVFSKQLRFIKFNL